MLLFRYKNNQDPAKNLEGAVKPCGILRMVMRCISQHADGDRRQTIPASIKVNLHTLSISCSDHCALPAFVWDGDVGQRAGRLRSHRQTATCMRRKSERHGNLLKASRQECELEVIGSLLHQLEQSCRFGAEECSSHWNSVVRGAENMAPLR